jgi:hypothetical protein
MAALADWFNGPRSRPWPARLVVWCAWLAATTVGWMVGSVLVLLIQMWTTGAADAFVHTAVGSAVLGGMVGLGIGVAQSLVLRRELMGARSWIAVNIVTWAAAWAVGQAIADALFDDYALLGLIPGGVLLAVLVGLGEWLLLRRYVERASWWLIPSIVAWAGAGTIAMFGGAGLLAIDLAPFVGLQAWAIAAAPGAFAGLITGAVLTAWGRAATR